MADASSGWSCTIKTCTRRAAGSGLVAGSGLRTLVTLYGRRQQPRRLSSLSLSFQHQMQL
jgi:hypothetical protein